MNKYILFLAVILLIGCAEKKTTSVIQGTWDRGKVETIYLFKVENGSLKNIQSTTPDKEGQFVFDFEPEYEGFYVVGPQANYPLHNYSFYLKPGDDLQVIIEKDRYQLTGENTPENKVMAQWEEFIFPLRDAAVNYTKNKSTYKEFFPLVEEKSTQVEGFEKNATGNKKFNNAFQKYKEYDFLFDAVYFVLTPRTAFPTAEDMTAFYQQISLEDITRTEDILSYPYGLSVVNMVGINKFTNHINSLPEEQQVEVRKNLSPISFVTPMIIDNKIKGEFLNSQVVRVTNYQTVKSIYEEYGQYLVTDAQKETFTNYMEELGSTAEGNPAIDFKFPDMDGNEIALSDFKGKVVYIDVWATWCGPCKKEIPYLKELEKEYHGKDIVFMSVSTDAGKDYEKWKKMVLDEELKGVQLFAGDRSREEIINPYRIKGIPRFMLIDKVGNIISNDAERPSAPDIRKVLDAALVK